MEHFFSYSEGYKLLLVKVSGRRSLKILLYKHFCLPQPFFPSGVPFFPTQVGTLGRDGHYLCMLMSIYIL